MPAPPVGFSVVEHVIPSQHIREYHHAVKREDAPLQLAIKEYRPLQEPTVEDAVTIIAGHGNGFVKEMYEPIWEELQNVFQGKIRAIWFADCTHQGASGVLNENLLGDDPNYFDHSRDLLHMINHFREQMPRPIVGVAHSMGTCQLVQLSLMHPRLLDSLVLIEPVIHPTEPLGPNAAYFSSVKPDRWLTRAEAESSFRKAKFFKSWDPRVLDAFLAYGLRDHDTKDRSQACAVTLTTPKAQEAWSYLRSNFSPMSASLDPVAERRQAPDTPASNQAYVLDRAEMLQSHWNLPFVRPAVLWVFAGNSFINTSAMNLDKLNRTGTGVGGSGGVAAGAVEALVLPRTSHLVPFEKPKECAKVVAEWSEKRLAAFREEERWWREHDSRKSINGRTELSKEWMERVKQKPYNPRPIVKGKL